MSEPWYIPFRERATWSFCDNANEWTEYADVEQEILELAYKENMTTVKLDNCEIDLNEMIQYTIGHLDRQGRVDRKPFHPEKRISANGEESLPAPIPHQPIDQSSIESKKSPAPPDHETLRTFDNWSYLQLPLVEKWLRKYPHYKHQSEDTVERIAAGIEKEGDRYNPSATVVAKHLADQLRKHKRSPLDEIVYYCVSLYTRECFLYHLVNKVLRGRKNEGEKEGEKEEIEHEEVETLGPFCCMLRDFLHDDDENEEEIRAPVYRTVFIKEEIFKEYTNALGTIKTWPSFSSTSLDQTAAENFNSSNNTIFIIKPPNETAPCYPGRTISKYSVFPTEAEVLLYPGVTFRIVDTKTNPGSPILYTITLSLM